MDGIAWLLGDVFGPDDRYTGVQLRMNDSVGQAVMQALYSLRDRERICVCMRYGITVPVHPVDLIGEAIKRQDNPSMPVSGNQVRVILAKALRKLRHPVRNKPIREALSLTPEALEPRRARVFRNG